MTCPPAEKLLEFAPGALPDDRARPSIEKHIDDCASAAARCRTSRAADAPPSFGRYRIDTVLGSGGMGIVYRAWDPQLARPVAIKVVRRAGDDTQGRARLVREAQALARLSHPNVCHVYDVGTEGDEVWVAMELIDGVSLRQWAGERARARRCSPCCSAPPRASPPRTPPGSSIATSSRRTCSSRATAARSSPTSGSRDTTTGSIRTRRRCRPIRT